MNELEQSRDTHPGPSGRRGSQEQRTLGYASPVRHRSPLGVGPSSFSSKETRARVRKELGHEAYGVLRSDPRAAPMVFEETAYRVPVCVSPSPEMVSTAVGRVVVLDVCRKWSILHLRWPMTEYSPREGPHSRPKESQMQYKRSLCFREKNPAR